MSSTPRQKSRSNLSWVLLAAVISLGVWWQVPFWEQRVSTSIGYAPGGDVGLAMGMAVLGLLLSLALTVWTCLIHIGQRLRGLAATLTFSAAYATAILPFFFATSLIGDRVDHPSTERFYPYFDVHAVNVLHLQGVMALGFQMLIWPALPILATLRQDRHN